MDRPEEGAALAFAILLGEPIGAAVEIPVLPAIIVRHPLHELPVDHGQPPCLGLVSRAQRRTKSCAAEPGPIRTTRAGTFIQCVMDPGICGAPPKAVRRVRGTRIRVTRCAPPCPARSPSGSPRARFSIP